jgi:hypothetical protein
MASRFSDIIAYFKKLASEHISIGHSEDEKHFYRYEIDEVLGGLKDINYPAFILEGYRYGYIDNKSDNFLKERTGAFILLQHLDDIGDYDQIHQIWDDLEEICDDIIARIKADKSKKEARAVKDFNLGSVNVALIANEHDRSYGVRCTFTIASPKSMEVDPDKWNYTE